MAIDFTLPEEVVEIRDKVRTFVKDEIEPAEAAVREAARGGDEHGERGLLLRAIIELRGKAKRAGLWNPHLPPEWGGLGLGPMAMASVSAECGRNRIASFVLNCQAPDEGNMHTLLHHATDDQKERYLRPLADGMVRSCFAMTEPEVAGSDPTGIRTTGVRDGDNWVLNRALERELHGGVLADKQGIQWMMAESAMELYAGKLMVLHTAYLIEKGLPFRQEVSMAKYHVANMLWRILDRAIQVHGALGYSTDTDLEQMMRHARSARLVDGADEVHLTQIARHVMDVFRRDGTTGRATGAGLLS